MTLLDPAADAKTRGMAIYQRAKETAMERAALAAYNAHFFKCTPSCTVADWTTAWKKAVKWWTEPIPAARVEPIPGGVAEKRFKARRLTAMEVMEANYIHGKDEYDSDPFIRKFCEVNGIDLLPSSTPGLDPQIEGERRG